MRAMDLVQEKIERGYTNLGDVDQAAVAEFLKGAEGAPIEDLARARDRLVNMVRRGEKARGTNTPTMAATADALTAIIERRACEITQ